MSHVRVHGCLLGASDGEVLLQLLHDGGDAVSRDQHHRAEGLHGNVVEGPAAAQTRVGLLLHRVVELHRRVLSGWSDQQVIRSGRLWKQSLVSSLYAEEMLEFHSLFCPALFPP